MSSLAPEQRERIGEMAKGLIVVLWIGGFFVAVQAALLKLAQ